MEYGQNLRVMIERGLLPECQCDQCSKPARYEVIDRRDGSVLAAYDRYADAEASVLLLGSSRYTQRNRRVMPDLSSQAGH